MHCNNKRPRLSRTIAQARS